MIFGCKIEIVVGIWSANANGPGCVKGNAVLLLMVTVHFQLYSGVDLRFVVSHCVGGNGESKVSLVNRSKMDTVFHLN